MNIGEGDNALQCTTSSSTCCRNTSQERLTGAFYYPDGTRIMIIRNATNGYYIAKGSGHILLKRQVTTGEIIGQFRCSIPDNQGTMVNLFINIGEYSRSVSTKFYVIEINNDAIVDANVSIISSGNNTSGSAFSLECFALTGQDHPTITWVDPMNNQITSGTVTTGSMSTLTFDPLSASDAGTYTCRATLGNAMDSASTTITVQSEFQ